MRQRPASTAGGALLLVLGLILTPIAAWATEPERAETADTWRSGLDRVAAVRSIVTASIRTGVPAPEALAVELGAVGGHAAATGVADLLKRGGRRCRLPAIRAAGRIALRSAGLANALREIARTGRSEERLAAILALGGVGDGRDVDLMVAFAASTRGEARAACFQALRRITGTARPPSAARWRQYCATALERGPLLLPGLLNRIETASAEEDTDPELRQIAAYAWTAPELVEESVTAWLRSPDLHVRGAAICLVAELRLADLARETRRIARHFQTGKFALAARRAEEVLGATKR